MASHFCELDRQLDSQGLSADQRLEVMAAIAAHAMVENFMLQLARLRSEADRLEFRTGCAATASADPGDRRQLRCRADPAGSRARREQARPAQSELAKRYRVARARACRPVGRLRRAGHS